MDKETKKEFETLARITKRGFDNIDSQISGIQSDITDIRTDAAEFRIETGRRFDTIEKKIDQAWNLIDGYVKSQEDFREEFKIVKHKMTKIEKIIRQKLGVEIE